MKDERACYWVVQNDGSYRELTDALSKGKYEYAYIKGDNIDDVLKVERECVMTVGSIEFVKQIRDRLEVEGIVYPVCYCTFERYRCSKYYSHFAEYLFNDEYTMLPLSELCRQRWHVYGTYGRDSKLFIRPDSGEKTFTGTVVDMLDLDKFLADNNSVRDELVVASSVKDIRWEGRFVVSFAGEIISHSTYMYQGNTTKVPSVPPQSIQLVKHLLKSVEYKPDSVFCFDVCEGERGEFKLLELTSFSTAGLYACDLNAVVKHVSEIALNDYNTISGIDSAMTTWEYSADAPAKI